MRRKNYRGRDRERERRFFAVVGRTLGKKKSAFVRSSPGLGGGCETHIYTQTTRVKVETATKQQQNK